jgi:hypothetical protein
MHVAGADRPHERRPGTMPQRERHDHGTPLGCPADGPQALLVDRMVRIGVDAR